MHTVIVADKHLNECCNRRTPAPARAHAPAHAPALDHAQAHSKLNTYTIVDKNRNVQPSKEKIPKDNFT